MTKSKPQDLRQMSGANVFFVLRTLKHLRGCVLYEFCVPFSFTAVTTEHGIVMLLPQGSRAAPAAVEEDVVALVREEDVVEGEAAVLREARVAPAVNHLEEAEPSLN